MATVIANVEQIGVAPSGEALFSWTENGVPFEDRYTTFIATSGTKYGLIVVRATEEQA